MTSVQTYPLPLNNGTVSSNQSSSSTNNNYVDEAHVSEHQLPAAAEEQQAISVPAPRFEVYTMTGSAILSKTNLRHHTNQHNHLAKKNNRVLSPTNIVLHSPVLSGRKIDGDELDGREVNVDGEGDFVVAGDYLSKKDEDREKLVDNCVFECSGHDVHGFVLTTTTTTDKDKDKSDGEHQPNSSTKNNSHLLVNRDLYADCPATPELVDNRPVWTVNAPVKSDPRFREILQEETIVTESTISQVTDTNITSTFIINSPRQPMKNNTNNKNNNRENQLEEIMDNNNLPEKKSPQNPGGNFVHPESARACMEVFPLEGLPIDEALRMFLGDVKLVGETQARQRVVDLFGMRYQECNPRGEFTRDSAYAVISAMLILNSDLHSQHRPVATPSVRNFIQSLREIEACDNIPDSELERIFWSIKNQPLPVAKSGASDGDLLHDIQPKELSPRSGYLYRKSCTDPGGKRTGLGRRGWQKVFVGIHELSLELSKNQKSSAPFLSLPLHHGYATVAQDYTKRKHVFRFRGIDESVSLFRATSEEDMVGWVVVLNSIAAYYSAPVAMPVGSQTVGSKIGGMGIKPMYTSKKSGLSPNDQLLDLRQNEVRLEREIVLINGQQPQSRSEALALSKQLEFYKNELERCRIYVEVLTGGR